MALSISVVLATYNRQQLLGELLDALGRQTLAPDRFEVIVVDDGSAIPVAPVLAERQDAYRLTVVTQANAGAAAARHAGVLKAQGDVVVITDDDMLVAPDFLAEHLQAHEAGHTLVLGQIAEDEHWAERPLFERFHAQQLARFVRRYAEHPTDVQGVMVCTGNVSFRRAEYLAVGGFDRALGRSEDRELGLRLQKAGARLYFAERARSINRSDHADFDVWMKRNFLYGVYDSRIAKKHPDRLDADPWHFLFLVNPISRGLLLLAAAAPGVGKALTKAVYGVSERLDDRRALHPVMERAALAGATLTYGLEYFRGVREEAGSVRGVVSGLARHAVRRLRAPTPR